MTDNYGQTMTQRRTALAKELKRRIVAKGGAGVMVRGGRGTGWGWIDVYGTDYSQFTPEQRVAVESIVGDHACGNCWVGRIQDVQRILGG